MYKIFFGNTGKPLAEKVVKSLNEIEQKKHKIGDILLKSFADGEFWCQIKETVRGCDVFIIQSTCTPVNKSYMELFILVDTLRRASAKKITAVIPYYGYARQDRKTKSRVPITSSLMAKLLESSGVDRVVCVDLHCGQIQGFFSNRVPVDNLYGRNVLFDCFVKEVKYEKGKICIVSPDAGGCERADAFRNAMNDKYKCDAKMAVMNKHREVDNEVARMELIGGSLIKGADCIIVDDIADTCGTLCKSAEVLKQHGAKRVFACVTHGLMSRDATKKIEESVIEKLFITDTVPLRKTSKKIVVCTIAGVIAKAIKSIENKQSLSKIFKIE